MKTFKSLPTISTEHKQKKESFISEISRVIVTIVKGDKMFSLNEKTNLMEQKRETLLSQIEDRKELLSKAKRANDDFSVKIKELDEQIFKDKVRLLEALGGGI